MTCRAHLWLSLAFLLLHFRGLRCLKDVTLTIVPEYVENGKHAALHCLYDLEGGPLYSVKWYRGTKEFYRYTPSDNPPTKALTYSDIRFHIDLNYSNGTVALLRNVGFIHAGNVSCEVTMDAPTFKVKNAYGVLRVVSLPRTRPELRVDKDRLSVGDPLSANCTSGPSRPRSTLSFYINNFPVRVNTKTSYEETADGLFESTSRLEMDLLPGDFSDGGQIILKCVSRIDGVYEKFTELRIGARNGDPVPERVRSPSGARSLACTLFTFFPIVFFCTLATVRHAAT